MADLGPLLVICPFAGLLLFASIFLFQRVRWHSRRSGFRTGGAALGDALQHLQLLAQPQVRYVVEKKEKEDVVEDDAGEPPEV